MFVANLCRIINAKKNPLNKAKPSEEVTENEKRN